MFDWLKQLFQKRESEELKALRSIDRRLEALEKCVIDNRRNHGKSYYVAIGHWNDGPA